MDMKAKVMHGGIVTLMCMISQDFTVIKRKKIRNKVNSEVIIIDYEFKESEKYR